jgi:hypothetical protein
LCGKPFEQFVGAAGAVGADQNPAAGTDPGLVAGKLRQRGFDDGNVIGGSIGSGVTRPEHDRQRFTGPVGLVVDEGAQRMGAEAAFERRRRSLPSRNGR